MERYEKKINLESLLLQWNLPDIKKEDEEADEECRDNDLSERSSDAFLMKEIAYEVSAIDGQILNENKSNEICNGGIDGVCQGNGDENTASEQKGSEAPSGEDEDNMKLVDYPDSSDDESEELFMSDDSDSELKDAGSSDQTELNPYVPEFVPLASRDNSPLTLPHLSDERKEDWEKAATDWQEGVGGILRGLREEAGQVGS